MLREIFYNLLFRNNRKLSKLIYFCKIQFLPLPVTIISIIIPREYALIYQVNFSAIVKAVRGAIPYEIQLNVVNNTKQQVTSRQQSLGENMVAILDRSETLETIAVEEAIGSINGNQAMVSSVNIPESLRSQLLAEVQNLQLPVFLLGDGFGIPQETFNRAWLSLGERIIAPGEGLNPATNATLKPQTPTTKKPGASKGAKRLMQKTFTAEDIKTGKNGFTETLKNFLAKITKSYTPQTILQAIIEPESELGNEVLGKLEFAYSRKFKSQTDSDWEKKKAEFRKAAAEILAESVEA